MTRWNENTWGAKTPACCSFSGVSELWRSLIVVMDYGSIISFLDTENFRVKKNIPLTLNSTWVWLEAEGSRQFDRFNLWLYANPAGLTGACAASASRRRAGLWANICAASSAEAILSKASLASERSHLLQSASPLNSSPFRHRSLTVVESLLLTDLFSPGFKTATILFSMFYSMWKRAEVLHLCEIWNISSKYIKAQCLINVFRKRRSFLSLAML